MYKSRALVCFSAFLSFFLGMLQADKYISLPLALLFIPIWVTLPLAMMTHVRSAHCVDKQRALSEYCTHMHRHASEKGAPETEKGRQRVFAQCR